MNREKLNEIIDLVDSVMKDSQLEFRCIETEWNQHDRVLRVFIDREIGSTLEAVVMNDCVAVTKALNEREEVDDLVKGAYNLEVSSPGVERPIRLATDFKALIGETVEVRVKDVIDGKRKAVGELTQTGNSEDNFGIIDNGETWEFALSDVLKAHVVYDWSK